MDYFIAKSIHIIFVISYFAGLFYIVRLFIYHSETLQRDEEPKRSILHKQYIFMQERLWNIITVPALIIMSISGIYMLYAMNWVWLKEGWMHIKLLFVVFLYGYHFWAWKLMRKLQKGIAPYSSVHLRMMNEVATLILFAVIFSVILKTLFVQYWYWSLVWFLLMGILIMLVVKLVNKNK
ncbi:hypothetical protein RCZ15_02240 [Capnocytophaga catalasegens]|uniref:Protoporphyrinogen IX oxidase n=2 Tax=Capnocytophaga catalasegens TaxID=1004260 RepID=A0AAV5ARR4_9FLAO|nr:hypothetical protein RCZ03_08710 [Capnocytophaga catalasegens]GJM49249.1 hypothetical protein RCZ15_02240 [Capnocytophaga catalasegens]GJM52399.1 hypothetical protein RCZ16_07160 [Capnocytophaga catalasegens]